MARMFPDRVLDPEHSHAETRLFSKIRDETPNDWYAIHSQGIVNHPKKPWAEIDFLLINPLGVWCIEVKGGVIEQRQGLWFTNGSELKQSPFAQSGGASAALHRYLRDRVPGLAKSMTGWGVAFPDTHFSVRGPEIDAELVYDDRDLGEPFEAYIKRVAKRWEVRLTEMGPRNFSPLSRADRSKILHEVAPDFRLVPTLRATVQQIDEEMVRLTEQQAEILDGMDDCDRLLVRGGAGTGKTILGVQEARRLAARGHRTLLCCYSARLADDLRSRLGDEVDVFHFHGLLGSLITEAGLWAQLPDAEERDLFDLFQPQFAIEALEQLDRIGGYDALVVDEAQDLMRESFTQVFDALLSGEMAGGTWRVFHDPNQDRFAAADGRVLDALEEQSDSRYRLRLNCRNTKQIATATSLFTTLPIAESLRTDGPDISDLWFRDAGDQARRARKVLERWLAGGLNPEQIVILSPRVWAQSVVRDLGRVGGKQVVDLAAGTRGGDQIAFSTIAGFKGLEAEAVLLLDLHDLDSSRALLDLYVGASRAKAFLALAVDESCRDLYNARAEDFAERLAIGAI